MNLPEFRGESLESFGSLVSLWKWLRSTFQVLYLIERKKVHGRRVVGMVGLYDLDMGSRAFLSAFLFHPADRGQGYGRESVLLFLDFLEKAGVARSIYVEVLRGNLRSLRFFGKMGFKIRMAHSDSLLMAKNFDRRVGSRESHDRKSLRYLFRGLRNAVRPGSSEES